MALCSALFSVAPSFADIATLPEPYYTNGVVSVEAWCRLHTITNSFVDYDTWEVYRYSILSTSQSLHADAEYLSGQLETLMSELIFVGNTFEDVVQGFMADLIEQATIVDPHGLHDSFWDTIIEGYNLTDYLYPSLDNLYSTIQNDLLPTTTYILQGVDAVTNQVHTLDAEFRQAELVDYVEVGMEPYDGPAGGGCHCPDYRSYLTYLQGQLTDVQNQLSWLRVQLDSAFSGIASVFRQYGFEVSDSAPLNAFSTVFTDLMMQIDAINRRRLQYLTPVGTNILAHIQDGWVFPTNTPSRPLYVTSDESTGGLSVSLINTNSIKVILDDEGTNWVNIANYDELIDLLRDLFEERDESEAEYSEEIQEQTEEDMERLSASENDATYSLNSPGTLEWFTFWEDFSRAFTRLSHAFPTSRDLDMTLSDSLSINLGGGSSESTAIEYGSLIVSGDMQKASTISEFLHKVSGFFWIALVLFLDIIVIRWIVILMMNGLAFVTAILSGDMSGLAKIIPALGRAVTGGD